MGADHSLVQDDVWDFTNSSSIESDLIVENVLTEPFVDGLLPVERTSLNTTSLEGLTGEGIPIPPDNSENQNWAKPPIQEIPSQDGNPKMTKQKTCKNLRLLDDDGNEQAKLDEHGEKDQYYPNESAENGDDRIPFDGDQAELDRNDAETIMQEIHVTNLVKLNPECENRIFKESTLVDCLPEVDSSPSIPFQSSQTVLNQPTIPSGLQAKGSVEQFIVNSSKPISNNNPTSELVGSEHHEFRTVKQIDIFTALQTSSEDSDKNISAIPLADSTQVVKSIEQSEIASSISSGDCSALFSEPTSAEETPVSLGISKTTSKVENRPVDVANNDSAAESRTEQNPLKLFVEKSGETTKKSKSLSGKSPTNQFKKSASNTPEKTVELRTENDQLKNSADQSGEIANDINADSTVLTAKPAAEQNLLMKPVENFGKTGKCSTATKSQLKKSEKTANEFNEITVELQTDQLQSKSVNKLGKTPVESDKSTVKLATDQNSLKKSADKSGETTKQLKKITVELQTENTLGKTSAESTATTVKPPAEQNTLKKSLLETKNPSKKSADETSGNSQTSKNQQKESSGNPQTVQKNSKKSADDSEVVLTETARKTKATSNTKSPIANDSRAESAQNGLQSQHKPATLSHLTVQECTPASSPNKIAKDKKKGAATPKKSNAVNGNIVEKSITSSAQHQELKSRQRSGKQSANNVLKTTEEKSSSMSTAKTEKSFCSLLLLLLSVVLLLLLIFITVYWSLSSEK